jgi:peptide chain release factor 1
MNISAIPWKEWRSRYHELSDILSSQDIDSSKRQSCQKELSHLSGILDAYDRITSKESEIERLNNDISQSSDPDWKELYEQEIEDLKQDVKNDYKELEEILFPPDPINKRSAFLEIRAGAGGQEASLFVSDLLKMYSAYAFKKNWRIAVVSASQTDLGGYREVILHIQGKNVYRELKFESGVHRVQRVPETETSGRVHTSTATVAVLPEADEVDVDVNTADLRIDVYRASGAGGQHVNTTDSAVRITHIPTGVVVSCQDERSQHKNKAKALKVLKSRILAAERERQEAEQSAQRKQLVGGGARAEKVRTYNFPQNRITDHQAHITLKKLDVVLENGELDEIIEALVQQEKEQRSKEPQQF